METEKKVGATGEHIQQYIVNRGCVKGIRKVDWNIGLVAGKREESESKEFADAKERWRTGEHLFEKGKGRRETSFT